jgi:Exocyst complex component Sec5
MAWIFPTRLLPVSGVFWRALDGGLMIYLPVLGFEVSTYHYCCHLSPNCTIPDASIFYYLESWVPSPTDPSATLYLTHIENFQRIVTTAAFKIAGGVDLSNVMSPTPRTIKQNQVAPTFVSKITKAFLDAIYAFLDGLVLWASDESPVVTDKCLPAHLTPANGAKQLQLLDVKDGVRIITPSVTIRLKILLYRTPACSLSSPISCA